MKSLIATENELEKVERVLLAAEDWSSVYTKDPETHALIIKVETKLGRAVRKHFRELSKERLYKYINWTAYHTELIKAFDINVIFNDDLFTADETGLFLNVVHDPILAGVATGAAAGQKLYNRDIGLTTSSASVLEQARTHSSQLVTGVTDTTRSRIQQSISTSLTLGENQADAAKRMSTVVNDPKRAEVIARTEAVNSFTKGLLTFADQSGASGKVWQTNGADDECADLDGVEVGIDEDFPGDGGDGPPLHPNCRCGVQLIYPTGDDSASSDTNYDDMADE